MTYLAGGLALVALVVGFFPPQRQEHRPAPYDRIVLHGGDNRLVLACCLCILVMCMAAVTWLLLGVLWGVVGLLAFVVGFIAFMERTGLVPHRGWGRR